MYPVITVPAFNDNYIWLIRHENHCLVVDPGDAAPVLERLEALGLVLDAILLTHHHHDHVGGVSTLLEHFPTRDCMAPNLTPCRITTVSGWKMAIESTGTASPSR